MTKTDFFRIASDLVEWYNALYPDEFYELAATFTDPEGASSPWFDIYSVNTGGIYNLEDIVAFLRTRRQRAHVNTKWLPEHGREVPCLTVFPLLPLDKE